MGLAYEMTSRLMPLDMEFCRHPAIPSRPRRHCFVRLMTVMHCVRSRNAEAGNVVRACRCVSTAFDQLGPALP